MNMIIFTMFYEYENSIANAVLISVVIGIIFSVLFYGESYCKIILSFFAYIILLPTNINLCCLFAICRNEDYL